MTVSKRDIQLLVGFAGVLLVVLTYFFVFTKFQEKTDLIKADNLVLKEEVDKLESLNLQHKIFMGKMEEYQTLISQMRDTYDVGYLTEDDIMYIVNMEKKETNQVKVPYLNMSGPTLVVAPETTVVGEMGVAPTDDGVALYQAPMNFGIQITYEGFKNMVSYLYSNGGRKNLESVSLMFDSGTGQLTGTVVLNRYFLSNTDKVYEPYEIPMMQLGTDNIFKTTDAIQN